METPLLLIGLISLLLFVILIILGMPVFGALFIPLLALLIILLRM